MKNFLCPFLIAMLAVVLFNGCQPQDQNTENGTIGGELIIFHAGSLSIPFKEIKQAFEEKYPEINVVLEAAGSVRCAHKITDLNRACDIMASADYKVIDQFLVPEFADSAIQFATNEMVIVFTPESKFKNEINQQNWFEILARKEVIYGRSDPNSDPCGYRAVQCMKLAEIYYNQAGITQTLLQKDREFIRPKASDLIALLQTNNLDYVFEYRSVAEQFDLPYLSLPDSINLLNPQLTNWYKRIYVDIIGKKPGETIKLYGEPMIYGITQIKNAPNPKAASAFINFLFSETGKKIIEKNGQPFIEGN